MNTKRIQNVWNYVQINSELGFHATFHEKTVTYADEVYFSASPQLI